MQDALRDQGASETRLSPLPDGTARAMADRYIAGASFEQIAVEYGVSFGTARSRVLSVGVAPRRRGPHQVACSEALTLDERRERVFVLYVLQRLDGPEAARLLGVSSRTVYDDLDMMRLNRRQAISPAQHRARLERVSELDAQGLTDIEVARDLGCSRVYVASYRDELGLPRSSASGPPRRGEPMICAWCGRPTRYLCEAHRASRSVAFCGNTCSGLWRFRNRMSRNVFNPLWSADKRQEWGRIWGGNTPARPGAKRGAPRRYGGRTPEQVLEELKDLRKANPKLGIRPLAERLRLTKAQLEYLLSEKSSA